MTRLPLTKTLYEDGMLWERYLGAMKRHRELSTELYRDTSMTEGERDELAVAVARHGGKVYFCVMTEEWCGDSGGRLIPICLIPLWDVDAAAREVRRNAARGVRAVAFSEIPVHLGLPSIHSGYWDPFSAQASKK